MEKSKLEELRTMEGKRNRATREAAEGLTLGEVYFTIKDALTLANQCGDILATVKYANIVNMIDDIINFEAEVLAETGEYDDL